MRHRPGMSWLWAQLVGGEHPLRWFCWGTVFSDVRASELSRACRPNQPIHEARDLAYIGARASLSEHGVHRPEAGISQGESSMKLNRGEPDYPHWKKPFSHKEMAIVWWGLGACAVVLGLQEWLSPSQMPYSGRWGWVRTFAVNAIGDRGPAAMYLSLGAIMAAFGGWKWWQHRSQQKT